MRHGPDLVVWHCAAEQPCSPQRHPGYLHVYSIKHLAHTRASERVCAGAARACVRSSYFLACERGREPWRTIANPSRASEQACVRACVRGRTHGACAAPLALCRLPFVVAVSPGLAFIWVSSSTFSAAAYSAFCSSARQNRQLACVHARARAQPGHTRARNQQARSRRDHARDGAQELTRHRSDDRIDRHLFICLVLGGINGLPHRDTRARPTSMSAAFLNVGVRAACARRAPPRGGQRVAIR